MIHAFFTFPLHKFKLLFFFIPSRNGSFSHQNSDPVPPVSIPPNCNYELQLRLRAVYDAEQEHSAHDTRDQAHDASTDCELIISMESLPPYPSRIEYIAAVIVEGHGNLGERPSRL
jgi:hypothetical protein